MSGLRVWLVVVVVGLFWWPASAQVAGAQRATVISGEYMETVACYLDEGREESFYTLTLESGAVYDLDFAPGVEHPEPGAFVTLRATVRDNRARVLSVLSSEMPVMPDNGNYTPIGEQKILVLLINFQDATTENTTPATVYNRFMSPTSSVNKWYQETSFGKMWIDVDVFGWYTLPVNRSCDPNGWRDLAIQAASPHVTFADYNRLVLLVPGGGGCSWGGLGTLGFSNLSTPQGTWRTTTSWCRSEYYNDVRQAIAISTHELGHNLAQHHASSRAYVGETLGSFDTNAAGGTQDEYNDRFDTMGNWNLGAYNARHKWNLGWFDPGHVVTVTASGTYHLTPYTLFSTGPKALKVFRGYGPSTQRNEWLYLEWRQPIGYDTDINWNSGINYTGALGHFHWNNNNTRTHLLDFRLQNGFLDSALQVGTSWTDNYRSLTVQVVSINAGVMTVNVNIGFFGVNRNPTSYTITRGEHVSGGLSDILSSDDSRLVIRNAPILNLSESEVMVVFNGTSQVSNPAAISFKIEGHTSTGGLRKMVELYNFSTSQWVATDWRTTFVGTDGTHVFAEENLPQYVQSGTNAIRARLRVDGQLAFSPSWQVRIDQAIWQVFPRS